MTRTERLLGYIGLFLIGVIGALADRLRRGERSVPWRRIRPHQHHGVGPSAHLRSLQARSLQRTAPRRIGPDCLDPQGAVAARVPRIETGTPDQEGRAPRRPVARHLRRRRRAESLHSRNPARARRRCPGAALHRDGAPARLPLHRRRHPVAAGGRRAAAGARRRSDRRDAGAGAVRAERRRQHRVSGLRQTGRSTSSS